MPTPSPAHWSGLGGDDPIRRMLRGGRGSYSGIGGLGGMLTQTRGGNELGPMLRQTRPRSFRTSVPSIPLNRQQRRLLWRLLRQGHPYARALSMIMDLLDLWGGMTAEELPGYNMAGWTLKCDNGAVPKTTYKTTNFDPGLICGTGAQVPNGDMGQTINFTANRRWIAFGVFNGIRMSLDEQWTRTIGLQDPLPWEEGNKRKLVMPPVVVPKPLRPIVRPSPPPITWPKKDPTPRPRPKPLPGPGPDKPKPYPEPWDPDPKPKPRPRPIPRPWPPVKPKPKPGPPGPPDPPGPPGPGVKERKINLVGPGMRMLLNIFHGLTELQDFTECLFEALPRGMQRGRGIEGHLTSLYRNINHVDIPQAVKCLVYNHFEDKLIGKLHSGRIRTPGAIRFGGRPTSTPDHYVGYPRTVRRTQVRRGFHRVSSF